MRKFALVFALSFTQVSAIGCFSLTAGTAAVQNRIDLFKRLSPAVCYVEITDDNGTLASGTGWILDGTKYLITAGHVVKRLTDADPKLHPHFRILTSDGHELKAKNWAAGDIDTGMIEIDSTGTLRGLKVSTLGNPVPLGTWVCTVGHPLGLSGPVMHSGWVSSYQKKENVLGVDQYVTYDMTCAPGYSGSPVCNDRGEVVGLVQAMLPDLSNETMGITLPDLRSQIKKLTSTKT
jgi:S1-C subfamily serine protease